MHRAKKEIGTSGGDGEILEREPFTLSVQVQTFLKLRHVVCEGIDDVVGVKAPLRGVAQVVFHGVQVVEVGVRLWVHQDTEEWKGKDRSK